jgi:hypothetical protein
MMVVESSILTVVAPLLYVFFIRKNDVASPEPVSPASHLHERKTALHEGLRDLQFDFRIGKLSEADYRASKLSLQKELAAVLLQIEGVPRTCCSSCGCEFERVMKFCGNCGNPATT